MNGFIDVFSNGIVIYFYTCTCTCIYMYIKILHDIGHWKMRVGMICPAIFNDNSHAALPSRLMCPFKAAELVHLTSPMPGTWSHSWIYSDQAKSELSTGDLLRHMSLFTQSSEWRLLAATSNGKKTRECSTGVKLIN